uniref:Uncharacterized protein n=1 Tax=Trieres chinensis TaxID=1514140 RepID=A0A7S2A5H7_TRICV|mmetsp:Transcript_406/g.898  ORF Transcript_406/g.898 Transcript_406/m.898 type:complete len:268 (+) Transcript_406:91-894(+)
MAPPLHTLASFAFLSSAVLRLSAGVILRRPPDSVQRIALALLVISVPATSVPWICAAPPRWRGVFVTSVFTSLFCATALILGERCVTDDHAADSWHGHLHPALAFAWAASASQCAWRCLRYQDEIDDATRRGGMEHRVFSSVSTFSIGGLFSLPCTVLNQAYMILIYPLLGEPGGPDAVLALALTDFACVYQLFLARRGYFPLDRFVDGAFLLSGLPGAAVLAAYGDMRSAAALVGALAVWLAFSKVEVCGAGDSMLSGQPWRSKVE